MAPSLPLPMIAMFAVSLICGCAPSTRSAYSIVDIEIELLDRTPPAITYLEARDRIIRAGDAVIPELDLALRRPGTTPGSLAMYVFSQLVRDSNDAAISYIEERLREGESTQLENHLLMALSGGGYEGRISLAALMPRFLGDRRIIGNILSSATRTRERRACDHAAYVVQTALGIEIGARPWRHDDEVVARAVELLATVR